MNKPLDVGLKYGPISLELEKKIHYGPQTRNKYARMTRCGV